MSGEICAMERPRVDTPVTKKWSSTLGRAGRRRRARQKRDPSGAAVSLDGSPELVALRKWMCAEGASFESRFRVASFPATGRGVMARERVRSGDALLRVPSELLITTATLEEDDSFAAIVTSGGQSQKFPCQELLAFYVALLEARGDGGGRWAKYMATLPRVVDAPYRCDAQVLDRLVPDERISDLARLQREQIDESHRRFASLLAGRVAADVAQNFTRSLYEWAYFIVDSRCVFVDATLVRKSSPTHRIFPLLSDEPCICLVPYLDLFNHSHGVETATTATFISDDAGERRYRLDLLSLTEFARHSQIFIRYGNHCNLKLIAHYGFRLPHNPFTTVPFYFSDIRALIAAGRLGPLEKDKYGFITRHNLQEDVYLGAEGYSFNFLRLLFVITSERRGLWRSKIFTCDYDEEERDEMSRAGAVVLHDKRERLMKKLQLSSEGERNDRALTLCFALLSEYVAIIDKNLDGD